MKKIIVLIVTVCIVFGGMSIAFADTTINQANETGYILLEKKSEIITPVSVTLIHKKNDVPTRISEFPQRIAVNIKQFKVDEFKEETFTLYFIDNKIKLAAGGLKLEIFRTRYEEWYVDNYGRKIERISTTPWLVSDAGNTYWAIPPFDVWIDNFDKGVGTPYCEVTGKVNSTHGGALSFMHRLYAE